jgi:hypothetical protein
MEKILCAANWHKDLELKRPDVLEPRNFRPNNVDRGIVFCRWRYDFDFNSHAIFGKFYETEEEALKTFL